MTQSVAGQALLQRASSGLERRGVIGWIQRWQGGQLLTFWAGATVIPWQITIWRETLIRNRLEGFLNLGGPATGWTGRVAEMVVYFVLPLLAVGVTAVWVSGRVRRTPAPRG